MSGMSDSTTCPNCGEEANRYSDYKPFDLVTIDCDYCGFYTSVETGQSTLEELNERRDWRDMKPLKKLPKMKVEF